MEIWDQLVKLASFGTSGVCILAVFVVGASITRLPKDSPEWRVSLMKRYINFCVIIALVSALSGGANAYFNEKKRAEAESDYKVLKVSYDNDRRKVTKQNAEINSAMLALKNQLQKTPSLNPEVWSAIENIQKGITQQKLTPEDKIFAIK